jgi:hypothetical protein
MPLFPFFNTQSMHIKSIIHNSIVVYSWKSLFPDGIRTRVFCSWGGCNGHSATPPGQTPKNSFNTVFHSISCRDIELTYVSYTEYAYT